MEPNRKFHYNPDKEEVTVEKDGHLRQIVTEKFFQDDGVLHPDEQVDENGVPTTEGPSSN